MTRTNLKTLALKYTGINMKTLEEREEQLTSDDMRKNLCGLMANNWEKEVLLQPAIIASIHGSSRLLQEIIEEKVAITKSNESSWLWALSQLKVNAQREKIDMFICELIEILQSEEKELKEEEKESSEERLTEGNIIITSFISSALGALVVNLLYAYWLYIYELYILNNRI